MPQKIKMTLRSGLGDKAKGILKKAPSVNKQLEPEVIFENENYLVIFKPAGLLVHPIRESSRREATLINWLIKKNPKIVNIGEYPERPGIVHRLDKEVSGTMVIAKTQDAFMRLKQLFKEREVKKEYHAVVIGKVGKDEGEINMPIKRSKKTGLFIVSSDEDAKSAKTEFEIIKRLRGNYTLLKLWPKTGRTNQLRVHLKAIGHPIAGDPLYQTKKRHLKKPVEHILLHSYSIEFPDQDSRMLKFKTEPPRYFLDFIKKYE